MVWNTLDGAKISLPFHSIKNDLDHTGTLKSEWHQTETVIYIMCLLLPR